MHEQVNGRLLGSIQDTCVVCEQPLAGATPHRCPAEVLELYEEAERIGDLLDDPEGPTIDELFPDREGLEKFWAYGLFTEYR